MKREKTTFLHFQLLTVYYYFIVCGEQRFPCVPMHFSFLYFGPMLRILTYNYIMITMISGYMLTHTPLASAGQANVIK